MPKNRTRKRTSAGTARNAPRLSQAHAFYQKGDLENAAKLCRLIAARQPKEPMAWHLLGAIVLARGDPAAALRHFERAVALAPPTVDLLCAKAAAQLQTGETAEGETTLRDALALDADEPQAHALLGQALRAGGRMAEAQTHLERVTDLAPNAAAWTALGRFYLEAGDTAAGLDAFDRALALEPTAWGHQVNRGAALQRLSRREDAVDAYVAAWQQGTRDHRLVFNLAGALRDFAFDRPNPDFVPVLTACLAAPGFDKQGLARPTMSLLSQDESFASALDRAGRGDDDGLRRLLESPAVAGNELFRLALATMILNDESFETLVSALRRVLLAARVEETSPDVPLAFVVALAHQFWNTEYLYEAGEPEDEQRRKLTKDVADILPTLDGPTDALAKDLALLACYAPLTGLGDDIGRPAPDPDVWPEPFGELVRRQIAEPDRERELATKLPALGAIADQTSQRVRDQYEANPYPRWQFANVENLKPVSVSLADANAGFTPPAYLDRPGRLLIAGCGTGKQAIEAARRQPDWQVFAVDLSRPSLAYAWRQAESQGIGNLRFAAADILALDRLDARFEIIECTGVLHHLADPVAGWRVLTKLLEPGGLMRVGLYSRRARESVLALRDHAENHAIPPTREGIRRLRHDIRAGDVPPLGALGRGIDFYTFSGGRDLMLHEQEQQFTLPEIAEALETLGLTWIGLEPPRHPAILSLRTETRFDGSDLSFWDGLERQHEDLFAGMYVFWCQRPQ